MHLPSPETPIETFGSLLRRLRLDRKLSQSALAERAQMSVEAVSALERGFRRSPQAATIALLVSALELDELDARHLQRSVEPRAFRPTRPDIDDTRARARNNVPTAANPLIGRERDLAAISELVVPGHVITIAGPGGIGKTRVAIAVARVLENAGIERVFFVDFSALGVESSLASAIAEAIGVVTDGRDTTEIEAAIGRKPLLLILDNCEHVAREVGAIVQGLVARCAGLRVLCTSRQPIGIPVESVYRLSTLAEAGAVALFEDRARLADARFVTSERARATIAALCAKLDGLPLAIELVAARVATLSLEDLLKRVDRPLRLIGRSGSTTGTRQQTMRATLDWSFALLNGSERDFFIGLSIFADGWTLESAHAVAGSADGDDFESLDLLESLIAKSFVVRDPRSGRDTRYRMLETMRAYGIELIDSAGSRDRLSLRALHYFRDLQRSIGATDDLGARNQALEHLSVDQENITVALDDAVRLAPVDGVKLMSASEFFPAYTHIGQERFFAWIAAFAPHLPSDDVLCSAFWRRAVVVYAHEVPKFANERARALASALACARKSGDADSLVLSVNQNVLACLETDSFAEADAFIAEITPLENVSKYARRSALKVRGELELTRNNLVEAKAIARELATLARNNHESVDEFSALENLLEIALTQSDRAAVVSVCREVESLATTLESFSRVLAGLPNMLSIGGYDRDAYEVAIRLIDILNGRFYQKVSTYRVLALSFALTGRYETAAALEGFARAAILMSDAKASPVASAITAQRLITLLRERLDAEQLERLLADGSRLDDLDAASLATSLHESDIERLQRRPGDGGAS